MDVVTAGNVKHSSPTPAIVSGLRAVFLILEQSIGYSMECICVL